MFLSAACHHRPTRSGIQSSCHTLCFNNETLGSGSPPGELGWPGLGGVGQGVSGHVLANARAALPCAPRTSLPCAPAMHLNSSAMDYDSVGEVNCLVQGYMTS